MYKPTYGVAQHASVYFLTVRLYFRLRKKKTIRIAG